MLKDNRAVTSRIVESSLSVETGATAVPTITDTNKRGYTWRIDLATTESHWKGWFQGERGVVSRLFRNDCRSYERLQIWVGVMREL